MMIRWSAALMLFAGMLAWTSVSVFAEEQPVAAEGVEPVAGEAVGEAITRVPVLEQVDEDQVVIVETPQETFLRLAQNYLFRTELGPLQAPGEVPLWPRGDMRVGPILIFPYIRGNIGWTDNAFMQSDKESSWFMDAGAGFAAEYSFAGGAGSIGLGFDYVYRDYFNVDNDYDQYVGGISVGYAWPKGLWFEVGLKYEHLASPYGIEFEGTVERNQFYPYLNLGWSNVSGGKFQIDFGIQGLLADFIGEEWNTGSRNEADIFLTVSYPINAAQTAMAYVRYDYRWDDPDSERINQLDSSNQISFGVNGSIPFTSSERLVGFIEIGYRKDAYAGPTDLSIGLDEIPTDSDSNPGNFVGGAGLTYLVGPKTTVDLRVGQTMAYSTRSNYQLLTGADLAVTYNLMRDLVLRLGGFFDYSDPSDSRAATYTRFGCGLGGRYLLSDNLDLTMDLETGRRNSSQESADYTWFTGLAGVTIYFR